MNDILEHKGYYASVHFNAKDEVFYGKLVGIEDLVVFEGASVKELKKSFHASLDDYLQTCAELGKEPNKTYKGTFNVRISTDLHKAASVFAAIHNISLNDFVKTAIDYALLHKGDFDKRIHANSR